MIHTGFADQGLRAKVIPREGALLLSICGLYLVYILCLLPFRSMKVFLAALEHRADT